MGKRVDLTLRRVLPFKRELNDWIDAVICKPCLESERPRIPLASSGLEFPRDGPPQVLNHPEFFDVNPE